MILQSSRISHLKKGCDNTMADVMTDAEAVEFEESLHEIAERPAIKSMLKISLSNDDKDLAEICREGLKTIQGNPDRFKGIFG